MVINERCIKILSALNLRDDFTLKKLSENLNVHTRTIRYDIDNINYILKSYKLSEIKKYDGGKLTLNIMNNDLNKIINDFGGLFSENRRRYLKLKLFSKELINLTKEAEILNVSRTTIKKDLNIIKNELLLKNILFEEVATKGIKITGLTRNIVEAFEEELQKVIDKQFIDLPNILKDLVSRIVGDITPEILKTRMKDILRYEYKTVYYNKIFCKLAALNTINKLKQNKTGYNNDEINTFIFCSKGKDFILKSLSRDVEEREEKNLEKIREVLREVMTEFEILNEDEEIERLLSEIGENKMIMPILEKICETNFYKYFYKKIDGTNLDEKEIQSIFYILYNRLSSVKLEIFQKLKILFISDELEAIKDIVEIKLKQIFKFEEVNKMTSHMFEIFGCEKDYDFILTNKNINENVEMIIYKMSNFPLENDFIDLKFFIIKNLKKSHYSH
ncbi:MAG: HTH domain-containing protein [Cetobacterium sp.]|uniref:HTH domain-containing protein n=1 Tax=Cetobacterium sp. TaxID=2071632 RepID=UPI003F2C8E6D